MEFLTEYTETLRDVEDDEFSEDEFLPGEKDAEVCDDLNADIVYFGKDEPDSDYDGLSEEDEIVDD